MSRRNKWGPIYIPDTSKSYICATWRDDGEEVLLRFDEDDLEETVMDGEGHLSRCKVGSAMYAYIVAGPAIRHLEQRVLEIAAQRSLD